MAEVQQQMANVLDLGTYWLAEGPCWDARTNVLSWVDIMEGQVHTWRPESGERTSLDCGQAVGAAVPRVDGGFVLALRNGVAVASAHGELTWITPNLLGSGQRFNDAKCDARGRLWAGAMGQIDGQWHGTLYRIDPDGTAHTMLTDIGLANGMGWSPDGNTYYFIDSSAGQVLAFDFDVEEGDISNQRVFLQLDTDEGFPDGMCVDIEGGLWIARFGGGKVERYDAHGNLTDQVSVGAHQATCPVLGGDKFRTLYITSGTENMPAPGPDDGKLFAAKAAVAGLRPYWFAG